MDEAEDETQGSDFSDNESGKDTSSGFIELSDRTLSEDEISSLKSDSTASNGKTKKRVTFQTEENLVLIREIPPRDNKSDTDTAVESESETSSETDSGSEAGDAEEKTPEKVIETKVCNLSKRNYDIGSASGKAVVKVAQITGAKIQQQDRNRNNEMKKIVKRRKRKQVNTEVTESSKSVNKNKTSKQKQIIKLKPLKNTKVDKQENDIKNNNSVKTKPKAKETSKIPMLKTGIRERPKSAPVDTSKEHLIPCPDCLWKNRSSGTNFITNGNGIKCNCVNGQSYPFWEIESDLSGLRNMDDIFARHKNGNALKNGLTSQSMHEFSSFHKLDMNMMTKTNKKLYSWLMANGNIPNPRDEAPCISPMWDSSQTAILEKSIVKAPT